jgi:hypothetical protein
MVSFLDPAGFVFRRVFYFEGLTTEARRSQGNTEKNEVCFYFEGLTTEKL